MLPGRATERPRAVCSRAQFFAKRSCLSTGATALGLPEKALQVQHAVADLLRAPLVPELRPNVAAGASGYVHL